MIFENKLKMRKLEVYLLMKYYKLSNSNNARTSNMSKSKPKPKNYDFNDVQISSIERKEMDDLKECTFVPKTISKSIRNLIKHKSNPSFIKTSIDETKLLSISKEQEESYLTKNKQNENNKSALNVFGRLYNEVQDRNDKKINKTMERSMEISKDLTFTPKILKAQNYISNHTRNNSNYTKFSIDKSRSSNNVRKSFDVEIEKVLFVFINLV